MTIEEARKLFPSETKTMTDELLKQYCYCVDILSEIFLNSLKYRNNPLKGVDRSDKHN